MGNPALHAERAAVCAEALPVTALRRIGELVLFVVALLVIGLFGLGDER